MWRRWPAFSLAVMLAAASLPSQAACPQAQKELCLAGHCICVPEGASAIATNPAIDTDVPAVEASEEGAQPASVEPTKPTKPVLPSRSFMGPHDIPPVNFAAYGIVAFPQNATSETAPRHRAVCEAFLASLPEASKIDVPEKEQMVTIWPLDDPRLAAALAGQAYETACQTAVSHYDLPTALKALHEARTQEKISLSGAGPYLLAWAPSSEKGKASAIVLIADLSAATKTDQFLAFFRDWREDIVKRPELWRKGWSPNILTLIQHWADKWGTMILSIGHAGG